MVHANDQGPSSVRSAPKERDPSRRIMHILVALIVVAFVAFGAGFASFLSSVEAFANRDVSEFSAQGIVVLTGGFKRLEPAAQLLKEGRGERLLISGVNRATSNDRLKNVLKVDDALFECCIDIDQDAMDTIGNAVGTADWTKSKGFESLLVVTNDYHMPRSMLELERRMGDVELIAFPVVNAPAADEKLSHRMDRYRVLLGEYIKLLSARFRGLTGES